MLRMWRISGVRPLRRSAPAGSSTAALIIAIEEISIYAAKALMQHGLLPTFATSPSRLDRLVGAVPAAQATSFEPLDSPQNSHVHPSVSGSGAIRCAPTSSTPCRESTPPPARRKTSPRDQGAVPQGRRDF